MTFGFAWIMAGAAVGYLVYVAVGRYFIPTVVAESETPYCWVTQGNPYKGFQKTGFKPADQNLSPDEQPMPPFSFYYTKEGNVTYILSGQRINKWWFLLGKPFGNRVVPEMFEAPYDPVLHPYVAGSCNQATPDDYQITTLKNGIQLQYLEAVSEETLETTIEEVESAVQFLSSYGYSFPSQTRIIIAYDTDALGNAGRRYINMWLGFVFWDDVGAVAQANNGKGVIAIPRTSFEERDDDWRANVLAHELTHISQFSDGCEGEPSLDPCKKLAFLLEGEAYIMGEIATREGSIVANPVAEYLVKDEYQEWLKDQMSEWRHWMRFPDGNRVEAAGFTSFLILESPGGKEKGLDAFRELRLLVTTKKMSIPEAFQKAFGWDLEVAYGNYQAWRADFIR